MTLRTWALKPGEVRALSRAELLLLAARCAMRVEPWIPEGAGERWGEALCLVVDNAFTDAPRSTAKLSRDLAERGARACDRLEPTDEPLGRCQSYATSTLTAALDASALAEGAALRKTVIDAAKYSASIGAILAHAGRVRAPAGRDPVEHASLAIWDSIRADITAIAAASASIEASSDRVRALAGCGKLWKGPSPSFARRR